MDTWIVIVALIGVAGFSFMLGLFFGGVHVDDDTKEPFKGSLFDTNLDKVKRKRPKKEGLPDDVLTTDSGQKFEPVPATKKSKRNGKKR